MEREVGETVVRVAGNRAIRMVVFGGESDPALLGADTLEGLLLSVDPVAKRLIPAEAYLLGSEGQYRQCFGLDRRKGRFMNRLSPAVTPQPLRREVPCA